MEIRSITPFLDYWRNVRGRTRRVAECIPDEHIEWSPAAGRFTLGDQVRHLATVERYMYAETVHGRPSAYHGCGVELASGKESIMTFMDRLHAESLALFAQLSDDDLLRKCHTPAGTPISTWKWLRAMIEHEAHHRGQIYHMLGTLGVKTPPIFGLTAEELLARSTPATKS